MYQKCDRVVTPRTLFPSPLSHTLPPVSSLRLFQHFGGREFSLAAAIRRKRTEERGRPQKAFDRRGLLPFNPGDLCRVVRACGRVPKGGLHQPGGLLWLYFIPKRSESANIIPSYNVIFCQFSPLIFDLTFNKHLIVRK